MAQSAITDFWTTYTGIIGSTKINGKMNRSSKLLALFRDNRDVWKQGAGFVQKHIQYDRVGITADADAEFIDGDNAAYPEPIKANSAVNYGGDSTGGAINATNNVDPPADVITFNPAERGYGLLQKSFKTNNFSIESLRAAAESKAQSDEIVSLLTDLGTEYWVRMYQDEFARISGNRFIALADGKFTENGDSNECFETNNAARWNTYGFGNGTYDVGGTIDTPDKQNTKSLSWAHLESIKMRMLQEDATGKYATAMADGMPVCVLVCDLLTAERLKTQAAAENSIRTDLRESDMSGELLKGLGVTYALKGWLICPEISPKKFTITGDSTDSAGAAGTGVWNEQVYQSTSGSSRVINSAYRSAGFTESYVMLPKAFSSQVPNPSYTGGGAYKFSHQDYSGDYEFNAWKDADLNPWGAHGFFQGKIASSNVAKDSDVLYTIRHAIGALEGVA